MRRLAPTVVLTVVLTVGLQLALPAISAAQRASRSELQAVVALVESGRPDSAESELRRLLARSESAAARDLLARLLLRQGRADEALPELRRLAQLGPLERQLAQWLAEAELAAGNVAQAEAQLVSLSERFDSVRALMQLARLQARRGENRSAAETLGRAAEIAPNSEEVLAAEARLSLTLEAPVGAIRALESLGRMHPAVAEHAYLLGVARLQLGDMTSAIEALQQSLEIEPERPLALIALGTTLNAQKRFAEAREVLRRSLRLDPANVEALAELSEAEEGLDELELAEEHAAQALARDDDHPGALVTLGLIRMTQARYEEARDAFLRAVAGASGSAKAHYQLSLAFARLGDRESSKKHLELYREARQAREERLLELRTRAGLGISGMGPP